MAVATATSYVSAAARGGRRSRTPRWGPPMRRRAAPSSGPWSGPCVGLAASAAAGGHEAPWRRPRGPASARRRFGRTGSSAVTPLSPPGIGAGGCMRYVDRGATGSGHSRGGRPVPARWSGGRRSTATPCIDIGDGRRLERFGPWPLDRPAADRGRLRPPRPRGLERRRRPVRDRPRRPGPLGHRRAGAAAPWTVDRRRPDVRDPARRRRARSAASRSRRRAGRGSRDRVAELAGDLAGDRPPEVLNLFAHTGGSTLAAARAGARVVHVDAGAIRGRLGASQRRAQRAGRRADPLDRRRRRCGSPSARRAAAVATPASSSTHRASGTGPGRASRGSSRRTSPSCSTRAVATLADGPAFVVLTAHTTGFGPDRLPEPSDGAGGGGRRSGVLDADELAPRGAQRAGGSASARSRGGRG